MPPAAQAVQSPSVALGTSKDGAHSFHGSWQLAFLQCRLLWSLILTLLSMLKVLFLNIQYNVLKDSGER